MGQSEGTEILAQESHDGLTALLIFLYCVYSCITEEAFEVQNSVRNVFVKQKLIRKSVFWTLSIVCISIKLTTLQKMDLLPSLGKMEKDRTLAV